jgi:tetratricopeptide (TPR) repeat protein
MAYSEAKKDCDTCISLDPKFIKGFTRKATIHIRLSEFHKAMAMYEKALLIDPENTEVKAGIREVNMAISKKRMQGGASEEERQRAMADPEIQEILRDSKMRELMRALEVDPRAAQKMVNESADLRQKYERLVQAGLV